MRHFDTARLQFRLPAKADFDELALMCADPLVTRYTSRQPASHHDSWNRLMRYRGFWDILGFGFWCVRERETGRFVGTIGFGENRRDLEPSLDGCPEAGWVLASWCHGMGYGREGVAAAMSWLDQHTAHDRTRCIIDTGNLASLALAAHNGFLPLAQRVCQGSEIGIFERHRPERDSTTSPDHGTAPV